MQSVDCLFFLFVLVISSLKMFFTQNVQTTTDGVKFFRGMSTNMVITNFNKFCQFYEFRKTHKKMRKSTRSEKLSGIPTKARILYNKKCSFYFLLAI